MKGRNLLALLMLALVFACESDQSITGPKSVPFDPSDVIQDGAHGGNPDFWFLPPMVRAPFGHPNFVLGTFNNALRPSLRVEICELRNEHLSALGIPTGATRCKAAATNPNIDAPPIKTFPAGTVNLVNLPRRQFGWWSLFGLPDDGFYYVLWNTRQSNLNVNKFYRIKVLVAGSDVPLGIADVDPMSSLGQWRHTRTGEVVQMIDDFLLPIPFRVEHGALCEGDLCTSVTVTNNNDGEDQIVQYQASPGVVTAGASIPDCVLPGPDCPLPGNVEAPAGAIQSFVLVISRENIGGSGFASNAANISAQSAPTLCHPTLPLKQFEGCFNFTTIPELPAINEAGDVFLNAVTVAVCFELYGNTTDPRVPFVRLFASDPGEEPRLLPQASETAILTDPTSRDCSSTVIGNNSTGVMGFASAGLRKLQGGLGRFFGVKTAYALDVGIAGLVKKISNVGPALVADIESSSDDVLVLDPEEAATSSVKIVGRGHHEGDEGTALAGLAVTFTLGSGEGCNGSLSEIEGNTFNTTTNSDGVASVSWALAAGSSCTLTATGQAFGSSTFEATATVPEELEVPLPILAFDESERYSTPSGQFVSYNLTVTNYEAFPAALFAVAPELPSCAGVGGPPSSRAWVDIFGTDDVRIYGFCGLGSPSDLQTIWFGLPLGEAPPSAVYITVTDRATGAIYTSNSINPALPDLYFSTGSPMSISPSSVTAAGGTVTLAAWRMSNGGGNFRTTDGSVYHGVYLSVDPFITADDILLSPLSNLASDLQAGETFDRGSAPIAIPALEPGTYFLGMLIDRTNAVAEGAAESNNTLNAILTVTAPAPPSDLGSTLDAGDSHTCALRQNGTTVCWGSSPYGQMNVPSLEVLHQISGGFATTCGLRAIGSIGCWGSDGSGQVNVIAGTYTKVSAGSYQVCGLRTDQGINCWGSNDQGQSTFPPGTYKDVSAGVQRTCAVTTAGAIVCVGFGLGPAPAGTFLQVTVNSGNGGHACAIRTDHSIACWGNNEHRQVSGAPTTGSFTQVSAGAWFTCALRDDGEAVCWGSDASLPDNVSGVATPPSGPFQRITAGANHACGQRSATNIVCWGREGVQLSVPAEFQ